MTLRAKESVRRSARAEAIEGAAPAATAIVGRADLAPPVNAIPRLLVFTRDDPDVVTGGVETFTQRLVEAFPGSEVVAYAGAAGKRRVCDEARDAFAARTDLAQAVARMRPAAVIANGAAAWSLGRANAPVVTVYHGTYAGFGRAIAPLAPIRGFIARTYGAFLERRAALRRAAIVAVSHKVAEEVRRHYGVRASVRVIENSAAHDERPRPAQADARRPLHIDPAARAVLFIGRAEATKGFVEVLDYARARPAVVVLAAGVPPQPGLPANLRALGVVPRESMARMVAAADAVVLPSRYEGCSFALIEALAGDRPIVTTATGAFPHAGEHPFGVVIPVLPPKELAAPFLAAVDSVLATPRRFAPRASGLARFQFARFAREWRALIDEVAPDAK